MPLTEHYQIINKKFPVCVPIIPTECNTMKSGSLLFKKQHYNDYCYLEYNKGCDGVSFTLFSCDWKDFEKIESEFINGGLSFAVKSQAETFIIINALV